MIRPGMRVRLRSLPYSSHGLVIRLNRASSMVTVRWSIWFSKRGRQARPMWSRNRVEYQQGELEVLR